MTRLLVAYATKHESTAEIAQAIGTVLRTTTPAQVDVMPVNDAPAPSSYDAVVLGSAVYMAQWQPEAAAYLRTHADALARRPLWLFSSGPIGEPGSPSTQQGWLFPQDLLPLARSLNPRDFAVFAGRLDPAGLTLLERGVMKLVRAPAGDFRDWDLIRAWAERIGQDIVRIQHADAQA
jgi:menaquinone-dependent protoporphyrinogen oxidase